MLTISYNSSVKTRAGWRSAVFTAIAKKISEKRVEIIECIDINSDGNTGYSSLTGAKSKTYNVRYFANNEIGKIKNLGTCKVWS